MLKLHHFALEVANIDKSIAFYTENLGFKIHVPKTKVEDSNPKAGAKNLFYAYLKTKEGSYLELIEFYNKNEQQQRLKKRCPHIALGTDNFEATLKMLEEKNIKIFDGPHVIPDDVKILTVLDPDGYRIDIAQLLN